MCDLIKVGDTNYESHPEWLHFCLWWWEISLLLMRWLVLGQMWGLGKRPLLQVGSQLLLQRSFLN